MNQEILQQVKIAEARAEATLREARQHAEKILHEARHEAVELRAEITEAAHVQAKESFTQGMRQFDAELARVRQAFHAEMAHDTAQAQTVFAEVVDFVVLKFRERLGS